MKFRSRSTNRWVEELMMRRWKQDWLSGNEGKWVNIWRVEHKRPPCRVCCMCVYYAWAVKKYSSHTLSVNYSHLYDLKHLFTSLSCSLQKQWHSIQKNFTLPLYFPNCASDDIIHGCFFIRFFQKKYLCWAFRVWFLVES